MTTTLIPGANPVAPPAPGPQPYRVIREERASKLGARSTSRITFQVLTDEARQTLFLRISHNEGGGYINDEAVPLHAVLACLDAVGDNQIKAASFIPAFKGRSSNNPGAMAALLVHEKLIKRHAERPHLFDDGEVTWADWATRQLAVTGDLPIVMVGKAPTAPVAPTRKKAKKPATEANAASDAGDVDSGAEGAAATEAAAEAGAADAATADAAADEAANAVDAGTADEAAADSGGDLGSSADVESGTAAAVEGAAEDSAADAVTEVATGSDVSRVKVRRKGRITLKG